ncbi:MAG: hypothetical protein CO113_11740 [Elusimicrobia bacterium CG_4_9_14_3_um_filter_62_55]|nr:MAG: hypothetical protein COR54_00510 [Elusimicrobia bacterium CG22_combo_CG10-13_8_21_14_all_63_91]PJA15802.1 MAG: hypothetical protein COX66_09250 [Elusimicrobia bacterium CG_4_10_14_0_2_um_filter_63_34]PJB24894.1 MAG: hypothetical protein CO113_11740 [Elusimicrobia bacterium CG_4_9_14_3_um_filter_62_55]
MTESVLKMVESVVASVISNIPSSSLAECPQPETAALESIGGAARDAAVVTGALSLAPGPAGMATLIPELAAVWRRQARLVADIAALCGKSDELTKELMMYCLYRHVDRRTMKRLLVSGGEGVLVGRAKKRAMHEALGILAGRLAKRVAARAAARWVPVVGAGALAAYSYQDTKEVGKTALEVFTKWGDGSKPKRRWPK